MKTIFFLLIPFFGSAQSKTLKYKWTKISGPLAYKIESPDSLKTKITHLVEGKYRFELKVTNNRNYSARDTMVLTVNPAKKNTAKNGLASLSKF